MNDMATQRQKKVVKKMVENGGNVSKAMREVGYSPATAKNPKKVTTSKGFAELMDDYGLSDKNLAKKHEELMNAQRLDHMVFPLGPKENETDLENDEPEAELPEEHKERTQLTDNQIKELLASVNCLVRKIVHGETARHVYFWSPDNKSRKDALDMAFKIKGHYAPEKKHVTGKISLTDLFNGNQDEDNED